MAETTIELTIDGLDKLRQNFKRYPEISGPFIQDALLSAGLQVEGAAKKNAPVDTGRLRSSIRTRMYPLRAVIEANSNYAHWVHDGTKAHVIEPKGGKALFIKGMGFYKRVKHPGTKAQPFLTRGAEQSEGVIMKLFKRALDNIAGRLAQ